ncbi:hypothetical protein SISNIDRAFT_480387 [Sistotremastrum niveocremeum HHB9708]|uniref:DUF6697 domain-containing protein n=1 Tax=Sistotremastrum niveocremeum HHB9708 TaxID=1314777 RepID=A0A165ACC2_9AGAM|nr:hypothetical protein SISNIDRAFT_480387 [Sistotremastrum niveocremeum HHB9708]
MTTLLFGQSQYEDIREVLELTYPDFTETDAWGKTPFRDVVDQGLSEAYVCDTTARILGLMKEFSLVGSFPNSMFHNGAKAYSPSSAQKSTQIKAIVLSATRLSIHLFHDWAKEIQAVDAIAYLVKALLDVFYAYCSRASSFGLESRAEDLGATRLIVKKLQLWIELSGEALDSLKRIPVVPNVTKTESILNLVTQLLFLGRMLESEESKRDYIHESEYRSVEEVKSLTSAIDKKDAEIASLEQVGNVLARQVQDYEVTISDLKARLEASKTAQKEAAENRRQVEDLLTSFPMLNSKQPCLPDRKPLVSPAAALTEAPDDSLPLLVNPHRPWPALVLHAPVTLHRTEIRNFSRSALAELLGGGQQATVMNISDKSLKPIAAAHAVRQLLYASCVGNPGCPRQPGMSGYVNIGLGRDVEQFLKEEIRHLFAGTTINRGKTMYCYMGKYKCRRRHPLPVSKWLERTDEEQLEYASYTQAKTKDLQTQDIKTIRSHYEKGRLFLPCVEVEFIEYDLGLAKALAEADPGCNENANSPQKRKTRRRRTISEPVSDSESGGMMDELDDSDSDESTTDQRSPKKSRQC